MIPIRVWKNMQINSKNVKYFNSTIKILKFKEKIMPKGNYAATTTSQQTLGDITLKKVVDYNINISNLNFLDRVARYFLAIAYSSVYPGSDKYNQAYVAARTVAAALNGNKLYLAANELKGLGLQRPKKDTRPIIIAVNELRKGFEGLIKEFASEGIGGITEVVFVANPFGDDNRTYHAEMQLVDLFYEGRMNFDGGIIGVSKPCCMQCALSLDKVDINYSYWHNEKVGVVIPCDPIAPW